MTIFTFLGEGLKKGRPKIIDGRFGKTRWPGKWKKPHLSKLKRTSMPIILWMDEILHHFETIVCRYLQGSHNSRVSERWCEKWTSQPSTVGNLAVVVKTVLGSHFGVFGAPPMLEPILLGSGICGTYYVGLIVTHTHTSSREVEIGVPILL